ncbi:hypothetical protein BX600DRAFT_60408 [Xylariales sp. PMI_506]|nr:hypothetical protein BX600DRAFT_60408 [Xylariales sp. PMI_506]
MPMSPLPDAAPPPYSSIKETTPNIASAPYVMHARIPDEPVKSIYSDPKASKRKDLGEKIMRQPTQAREDRAFEDQGLAALLGASGVIPAVVETTIVHQETNMNGPINITVNVNNYSGTSNSVTIPRDQGDLREADMRTAMNAAHTALQNLSLHHNTTTQSPVENCCPVNPYEAPAWSGLPPERPPKVVMSESGVHEFGSWTQQTEGRGANPEDPQLPGNSNVRVDYMSNDSAKQMRNSVQIPQSVQWGSCSQEGSTSEARRVGADPVIQNTFYALPSTPFPGPEQCGYFDMPMGPEIPTPPPTQDFYRAPGNTLLAHPQSTVRGPSTAPSCDPYSPPATHHNLPYPAASYHLSAQGAAIARPSSTQIQATPSPISAGAHAPHIGEARYFVPSPQYVDSSLPNRPNSLAPSPMSTGAGAELFSPQGLCAVGASPGVQSRGGRELGTASMAPSFPASNYHNHQIYPAELE